MKRLLLTASASAILAISAGSTIHPFGSPKKRGADSPLFENAKMDDDVRRIFERSCASCHSEKTEWPWYGYVAPMSWMIERDVVEAREHMNLSRWPSYPAQRRLEMLGQIGAMVRGHLMPPSRYLALHPEAKLSEVEVDILYKWERAERTRLKSQ